ncbi:hypothetical protein [Morganella sp. GD04133]|uniref:hypothetical protein n=1 Tax=Morganella sp. GD04133 TaxID=2975435 RepID=UPI0024482B54|nr:hypothetical protein [Morganella sp. GD04133]MDH0356665.1 hypothetical protein [Morganella sp. GD04133]
MLTSDKKERNGLPSSYCHRGDEVKSAIVRDYIIQPVAHLKLIPGQVKTSYSNYPLRDQYYCFSFQGRIEREDKGAFFCGKDVAKDFIRLINGTELPLFNPLKSEGTTSGSSSGSSPGCFSTGIKPNADKKLFIDAARLLMMLWDSTSKGQTPLAYVLNEAITDGIDKRPEFKHVLSVNTMLGNTNNTLTDLLAEAKTKYPNVTFRDFDFSPLNEIVKRSKYYDKHAPCY